MRNVNFSQCGSRWIISFVLIKLNLFAFSLLPYNSGTFDWTTSQQATVLGAFYYGYTVTQIPAGILARRYGGKLFFGLGILLSGIFTLLTPLASHLGVYWLIALRILEVTFSNYCILIYCKFFSPRG